jgi:nucleoside phosphorylase
MNSELYIEEKWEKVKHLIDGNFILIMTATTSETEALHNFIEPLTNFSAIIKTPNDSQTYYLGKFGQYKIAHVQCGMGSISRDASILTASNAIRLLNPKFLLMVGIAFGIDDSKQKIGDVLVSEAILPYNSKRIGKNKTIQRAAATNASKTILNRFKNLRTWEYFVNETDKSELICGHILSGEELIDNKEHRDELIEAYPNAKGGEMEGAGIVSACDGNIQWIIVKGICDFADGNKGQNKECNQKIAVNAAISACLEVFSSKTAFDEFKILISNEDVIPISEISTEKINTILFDVYDKDLESYYVHRSFDNYFNKNIAQFGIWLFGPSGCGKSNLILRNLIFAEKYFIQISLANCIGQNIDDFFKELLYELTDKSEGITNQVFPNSYKESHKAIINLLSKHYPKKEVIIFIEEIPIELDSDYKEFTEKMLSLLISKSYSSNLLNVKFVLSSINNPTKHIQLFQQKVFQQVKFIELKYWESNDIEKLINVISLNLKLSISTEFIIDLIKSAQGSPRFIKKYFRNLFAIGKFDQPAFIEVLNETEKEFKLN